MQLRLMIVGASSGPFGEAARMAQSLGAEVKIAETPTLHRKPHVTPFFRSVLK